MGDSDPFRREIINQTEFVDFLFFQTQMPMCPNRTKINGFVTVLLLLLLLLLLFSQINSSLIRERCWT